MSSKSVKIPVIEIHSMQYFHFGIVLLLSGFSTAIGALGFVYMANNIFKHNI